ncbi:hypothetical protein [Nonomuraea soli]|uniref:Uncharacterized protein n=1 Tax=Nonomuraea soli TaxID=1032476 RepID=A0A7W0HWD1_9ACTN|nr:hypothetical protein [Nonomuraea soli]MBA2897701.1 hypothetical protein [Nonomuraea soli]
MDTVAQVSREELLACSDLPDEPLRDPVIMHTYLLGRVHGVLHRLLDWGVRAELGEAGSRPTEIAVDLGALFQLGFDAGLIRMTSAAVDE